MGVDVAQLLLSMWCKCKLFVNMHLLCFKLTVEDSSKCSSSVTLQYLLLSQQPWTCTTITHLAITLPVRQCVWTSFRFRRMNATTVWDSSVVYGPALSPVTIEFKNLSQSTYTWVESILGPTRTLKKSSHATCMADFYDKNLRKRDPWKNALI